MSEAQGPASVRTKPENSSTGQESQSDSKMKVTCARSDISIGAEDENGPSSPHFYSSSVRTSSPSLDTYPVDTANDLPSSLETYGIDSNVPDDPAAEQQVHEQAVKLDLLRRQHSQKAKQTLEQLQTAASTASQTDASFDIIRSNSGMSMELVRQQSDQLKQASGDLKRLAEEQRTLAEEAVANFLLKVLYYMADVLCEGFTLVHSDFTATSACIPAHF